MDVLFNHLTKYIYLRIYSRHYFRYHPFLSSYPYLLFSKRQILERLFKYDLYEETWYCEMHHKCMNDMVRIKIYLTSMQQPGVNRQHHH